MNLLHFPKCSHMTSWRCYFSLFITNIYNSTINRIESPFIVIACVQWNCDQTCIKCPLKTFLFIYYSVSPEIITLANWSLPGFWVWCRFNLKINGLEKQLMWGPSRRTCKYRQSVQEGLEAELKLGHLYNTVSKHCATALQVVTSILSGKIIKISPRFLNILMENVLHVSFKQEMWFVILNYWSWSVSGR